MLRPPSVRAPALLLALFACSPALASAQDEGGEEAGASRGGYAWGEGGSVSDVAEGAQPERHRFHDVMVSAGAGGAVRLLAFADICDPDAAGQEGCRFSPAYLQLRGAFFFETDGMIMHGVGLGLAANLQPDGTTTAGIDPFMQWVISPSYFFRAYVLEEWVQVLAHVGVPLSIAGDPVNDNTYFNWGLEVAAGGVFKFLQGLGLYLEVGIATFFGLGNNAWPLLTFEGGAVFDYEVLP